MIEEAQRTAPAMLAAMGSPCRMTARAAARPPPAEPLLRETRPLSSSPCHRWSGNRADRTLKLRSYSACAILPVEVSGRDRRQAWGVPPAVRGQGRRPRQPDGAHVAVRHVAGQEAAHEAPVVHPRKLILGSQRRLQRMSSGSSSLDAKSCCEVQFQ